MSAKMETFFELKKVVDHDCGNYQIGEIDFVNYRAIQEYITRYGEFGWQQLAWVTTNILHTAKTQLIEERGKNQTTAQDVGAQNE